MPGVLYLVHITPVIIIEKLVKAIINANTSEFFVLIC